MFAIFFQENRKSDDCTLVRRQHITDTNSFKHFNVNPTCTLLNIYNDYSYSNSCMTDLNLINDVSTCLTHSQSFTEHAVSSSQSTVRLELITFFFFQCVNNCFSFTLHFYLQYRTNNSITESWREINHVDKIKHTAALLFHVVGTYVIR